MNETLRDMNLFSSLFPLEPQGIVYPSWVYFSKSPIKEGIG
jgi:hypothetical protein